MTKLFKLFSFLVLAFTLGYSQGWWRSYQNTTAPQPLIILTLQQYKEHPLLQGIFWEKIEKVIPYKVVIDRVPSLDAIKKRLSASPVKAHLLFLERKELLQLDIFFKDFNEFSPTLLDELSEDFTLEPKGKFFPVLWNNKTCAKKDFTKEDLKIWGFIIPQISKKANRKSLLFVSDLIHNPVSHKILLLTQMQLPYKKMQIENNSMSQTLRNSLFLE